MIVPRRPLLVSVGVLTLVSPLIVVLPQWIFVELAAVLCLGIVASIDIVSVRKKLQSISAQVPNVVRLSKDEEGEIPLIVTNPGMQRQDFRIGFPFPREIQPLEEDLQVQLPQDSEVSKAVIRCVPNKRGRYRLDRYYAEIPSALGFWSVRTARPLDCEVRVYPNLSEERKRAAAIFLNKANFGVHLQRMVGQGREFEKLREYIPGDSYDQIHWKATAKRGRPVTKIFQIERTQEVYAIIDASRLSAREAAGDLRTESILEYLIRAALVLGVAARHQGDHFGILTFSDKVHHFLRASNSKTHHTACRDALYLLQPRIVTPDFDDLFSFIRLRLRRRALLVILTDLNDPILAESFVRSAKLVARQHLLLVNMVKPPQAADLFGAPDAANLDDLYQKLAGHMLTQNLRELQNVLRLHGISLTQLHHPKLSSELVTQYMSIKQRQLL